MLVNMAITKLYCFVFCVSALLDMFCLFCLHLTVVNAYGLILRFLLYLIHVSRL